VEKRKSDGANNQATIWCTQIFSALKIFDTNRLRGEKPARTESVLSELYPHLVIAGKY
jgi:hypothetical protein